MSVSAKIFEGAVNVTIDVSASFNSTLQPSVCTHEYVTGSLLGSVLALPAKVTAYLSFTVYFRPALSRGGQLICLPAKTLCF
jgi:hypothetical protein